MVYIKNKYVYHSRKKNKKPILLIGAGVLLIIFIFFIYSALFSNNLINDDKEVDFKELWTAKQFDEIIASSNLKLDHTPFNSYYLAYKGLSLFYKGDSEIEERNNYYDRAVSALRKALIGDQVHFEKEISFILGMIYFYKGKYYYDLAVKYIEKALSMGYKTNDALVRLGLAYWYLDDSQAALNFFLEAARESQSDKLMLLIGKTYLKLNEVEQAKDFFLRAIKKNNEPQVVQEALFRLGDLYFEQKDYEQAKIQYEEILKIDKKSANAHFNLGEIYYKLNDIVKARAEWRETLRVDPSHYGAKLRYYK